MIIHQVAGGGMGGGGGEWGREDNNLRPIEYRDIRIIFEPSS